RGLVVAGGRKPGVGAARRCRMGDEQEGGAFHFESLLGVEGRRPSAAGRETFRSIASDTKTLRPGRGNPRKSEMGMRTRGLPATGTRTLAVRTSSRLRTSTAIS